MKIMFEFPLWLYLGLPISVFLSFFYVYKLGSDDEKLDWFNSELLDFFSQNTSKRKLNFVLLAFTLASLCIALSQPKITLHQKMPAPLLVALQLSPSMETKLNHEPIFETAKRHLQDYLNFAAGQQVWVLLYSKTAHQLLPPVQDKNILLDYLQYASPSIMPEKGNDLLSLLSFIEKWAQEGKEFNLWLIGNEFNHNDLTQLQTKMKTLGHFMIYSLGEQNLPGDYLYSANNFDVVNIYNDSFIVTEKSQQEWLEIGYYFLILVAIGVFLLWQKAGFFIVLCGFILPLDTQANVFEWWFSKDQQGQYYFNHDQAQKASEAFENKRWQAAAFVEAKDYTKAIEIYKDLDQLEDLYNLATAYMKARNYVRAAQLYQLLLAIDPTFQQAQDNLEICLRRIPEIKNISDSQTDENLQHTQEVESMPEEQTGSQKEIGQFKLDSSKYELDDLQENAEKRDQWLRDISKNPAFFLKNKFAIEAKGGEK